MPLTVLLRDSATSGWIFKQRGRARVFWWEPGWESEHYVSHFILQFRSLLLIEKNLWLNIQNYFSHFSKPIKKYVTVKAYLIHLQERVQSSKLQPERLPPKPDAWVNRNQGQLIKDTPGTTDPQISFLGASSAAANICRAFDGIRL